MEKHRGWQVAWGRIDNQTYGAQVTLTKGGPLFGVGYQRLEGATGYPLLSGKIPNLTMVNWGYTVLLFQANALGLPATFMTLHRSAYEDWWPALDTRSVHIGTVGHGLVENEQNERTFFANYALQSGPLKNLDFDFRSINAPQRYGSDIEEYRFPTTYPLNIWQCNLGRNRILILIVKV